MPYIGNTAADRFVASKAASVYSGDGSTTAFTLEHSVGSDEDILVSVDGVIQEPSVAYAVSSGTTLTFTAAPSTNSGNNIFVYYLFKTVGTIDHPATSALSATSGTFTGDVTAPSGTFTTTSTSTSAFSFANQLNNSSASNDSIVALGFHNRADVNADGVGAAIALSGSGVAAGSGNLIFCIKDTSGIANTVAPSDVKMTIDSNGAVTKPNQPAFLVRTGTGGSATNVPINATTIVDFGTEIFDRGADFSTNTFTAPVTGVYQINFSGVLSQMDTASTYIEIIIQCSNRNFLWTIDPDVFDQDAVYFPVNISCLADMDASDVAKIGIILPNDGTAQMDIVNYGYFSGYLVA